MTMKPCRKSTRRDPMQWNRNERFAEDFSVSRTDALARDELPAAFGTGESDPFSPGDEPGNGMQGSEQRLEMIRDISLRLQQGRRIPL